MTLSEVRGGAPDVQTVMPRRRIPARRIPGRRIPGLWTGVAVAGGWLVPLAAFHTGTAVLLPLLILFGTASLLRSGRTLLDRLMIAGILLFGATCAAGLLFSVWPWGLHPVAVAGSAFTALTAVAQVTGRRPQLPGPGGLPELFTALGTFGTAVLAAAPFLIRDSAGRLSLVVAGEDLTRHFFLFDGIREVGGYTFMNQAELAGAVKYNLIAYPQGSHLLQALLDNFVRSSTAPGDPTGALDHYLGFYVATLVLVVLSVLWAIRWVAGPALVGWRFLPVAAVVCGYLFFGDATAMFLRGFISEFAGLVLVALFTAVTVRPLARTREQVAVLCALLVAVAFTYYLFLPLCGLVALVWAVAARRRLLRFPFWTAGAALVTAVLSAVPVLVNMKYGKAEELNAVGGISPVNRHLLFLLLAVVAVGFLSRHGWRSPVRRATALWLALAGGLALLMYAYQTLVLHETTYYYEKVLHQLIVVALVSLGTTRILVPAWGARGRTAPGAVVTGQWTAAALVPCLLAPIVLTAGPDREVWRRPPGDLSWGTAYALGKMTHQGPAEAVAAVQRTRPQGRSNVLQLTGDWQRNYFGNQWTGSLSRNYGTAWPAWPGQGAQETPDALRARIDRLGLMPLRFFTDDPVTLKTLQEIRRDKPGSTDIEVMYSPAGRCDYRFSPVPAPLPGSPVPPAPAATAEEKCA